MKSSLSLVFTLLILLFLGSILVQNSLAQSYSTILILDPLPAKVKGGDTVTFSGVFGTREGYAITGATIYIKDDVTFGSDRVLGTVTTDDNGEFIATWEAIPRSSGSYDFYAIYEGSSQFSYARSKTYSVTVGSQTSSPNSTPPSSSGSTTGYYLPSTITLDKIPSSVYAGQVVTFSGKLTSDDDPLSGKLVYIKEDDPLKPDQQVGFARTDSQGRFSIPWKVGAGLVEVDFDFYAIFEGDSTYMQARSYNQLVSVLKYGGSISLDSFPKSVNVGEEITFSGNLQLNLGSPEGAIVYIKDEDPLNPDDLLATAYVDRNGKFSVNWRAIQVDEDDVADIYAVFEGNDVLYRLTTCDRDPTMPLGGGCPYTRPLTIIQSSLPPTIPPGSGVPTADEYMELYYSLDFSTTPKVTIVPSPDSYNDVRSYIIPVQEGVLMWESYMEKKYGGNWDVNFDIVQKDDLFFKSKPDVIINVVTHDDDVNCLYDYAGVTLVPKYPRKPIQASVCVTNYGSYRTTSDVSGTAGHEFIHAVGLGHTFNKPGDLMCSVEDGKPTCGSSFSKSRTPSDLNAAAAAKLYGKDGFRNPNNSVVYGTKFSLNDDFTNPPSSSTPSQNFPDTGKFIVTNPKILDSLGRSEVNRIKVSDVVQFSIDLKNDRLSMQPFAWLVQIQDSDGFTKKTLWITGSMYTSQSFRPTQKWIPESPGKYTATYFFWKGVDDSTSLAPPISFNFQVYEKESESSSNNQNKIITKTTPTDITLQLKWKDQFHSGTLHKNMDVKLVGKVITENADGVSFIPVAIYDRFNPEDLYLQTQTNKDGEFSINWRTRHNPNNIENYESYWTLVAEVNGGSGKIISDKWLIKVRTPSFYQPDTEDLALENQRKDKITNSKSTPEIQLGSFQNYEEFKQFQEAALNKLSELEEKTQSLRNSLTGVVYENQNAQNKINEAWTALKENERVLKEIRNGFDNANSSDDNTYKISLYETNSGKFDEVGNNFNKITQLMKDARDVAKPKFCFLFWCW